MRKGLKQFLASELMRCIRINLIDCMCQWCLLKYENMLKNPKWFYFLLSFALVSPAFAVVDINETYSGAFCLAQVLKETIMGII